MVPFKRDTLQIGFFHKVLDRVDNWEGQRCGSQFYIKSDLLKHFVKYGMYHYNKYKLIGYP